MSRCHPRRATASASFFCAVLLSCTAGDRSASRTDSGGVASAYTCLTPPPLLGVRLGDSVAVLRGTLGEALATVRSVEHRGSGPVDAVTYRYTRADVHVVGG